MRKSVLQVVLAVAGGLNTAIPLILDAQQLFPSWPWQIHALTGFSVFALIMIWMVMEYHNKLSRIENTRPNIVLKTIDEHFKGDVVTRAYDESIKALRVVEREYPDFTRIWIANEPRNPLFAIDAIKLYGQIEFWDEKASTMLLVMGGRWAETKEIASGGQPIEIDQIDIPPNGRPFCMDIGLKYRDEEEFYPYNNETPRKDTKGFRDQERKLGAHTYLVKVRFRCKGVDTSFWFKLENLGKGKEVLFTRQPTASPSDFVRNPRNGNQS